MSARRRRPRRIASNNDVSSLPPTPLVFGQPSTDLVPVAAVVPPGDLGTATASAGATETLDPELAAAVNRIAMCTHCGGRHLRACPRVRRMQWHPNASLAGVEFWPDGDWDTTYVLFPDEIATD